MSTRRTSRVGEVIRKELDTLMRHTVELDGIIITITGVDTSPDLKNANVYVSLLDPKQPVAPVLSLLNKHRGPWQNAIGKRLPIKFTPRLHFEFDKALVRGDRVIEILTQLDEQPPHPDQPDTPAEPPVDPEK